jgi:hypothetical protein
MNDGAMIKNHGLVNAASFIRTSPLFSSHHTFLTTATTATTAIGSSTIFKQYESSKPIMLSLQNSNHRHPYNRIKKRYNSILCSTKNSRMFQNAVTTFVDIADRNGMFILHASTTTDDSSSLSSSLSSSTGMTAATTTDNNMTSNNDTMTTTTTTTTTTIAMEQETPIMTQQQHDGIIELATKNDHTNYFMNEGDEHLEGNSLPVVENSSSSTEQLIVMKRDDPIENVKHDMLSVLDLPVKEEAKEEEMIISPIPAEDLERVLQEMEREADIVASELVDESCEVDPDTGKPMGGDSDICTDDTKRIGFRQTVKTYVNQCLQMVRGTTVKDVDVFTMDLRDDDDEDEEVPQGELLERGCKYFCCCCFIPLI